MLCSSLLLGLEAGEEVGQARGGAGHRGQLVVAILAVAAAAIRPGLTAIIAGGALSAGGPLGTGLALGVVLGSVLTGGFALLIDALLLGLLRGDLLGDLGMLLEGRFLPGEGDTLGLGVDLQDLAADDVADLQLVMRPSMVGSRATKAPKGTMRTTLPSTMEPTGYFSPAMVQGLGWSCL